MTRMNFFELASLAGRDLHSSGVRSWCAVFLANALDSSQEPIFQRAAAAFRAAANDKRPQIVRCSGLLEICDAFAESEASGNLVQCHAAACYLSLYFRALKQSNQVRAWLQVATDKAAGVIGALDEPASIDGSRLLKLVERLEGRENESPSIRVSASTTENTTNRMWDRRQAKDFFANYHNRRAQLIAGVGSGKYVIPQRGRT